MRLDCILVLIGVLFASSRDYIHHISSLMRMNVVNVAWNEFWHYNMRKVGQNSFKKHAKSDSNAFKLQSIATSTVVWIVIHLYSLYMYVSVLYMQLKSPEIIFCAI